MLKLRSGYFVIVTDYLVPSLTQFREPHNTLKPRISARLKRINHY